MRDIKKIKMITPFEFKIEYEEVLRDENEKPVILEISKVMRFEAHEDLLNALKNMTIHLSALCEFHEFLIAKEAPELIEKFETTGVSWGGHGEYCGVTIVGKKQLKENRVLNLVSPFCMFQNENSFYEFDYELMVDASILHGEILNYLDGKYAPSKQLELELT
jgi:hypothetical protein